MTKKGILQNKGIEYILLRKHEFIRNIKMQT